MNLVAPRTDRISEFSEEGDDVCIIVHVETEKWQMNCSYLDSNDVLKYIQMHLLNSCAEKTAGRGEL